MGRGSLPGGGIGAYPYVTWVQWNIFDDKPIFCDDLSLPSHTKGTQADPTIIFTGTSASTTTDHTHRTMAPPLPASSDPFSLHPVLFPMLYCSPISAAATTTWDELRESTAWSDDVRERRGGGLQHKVSCSICVFNYWSILPNPNPKFWRNRLAFQGDHLQARHNVLRR
jgi:hypothetical protein